MFECKWDENDDDEEDEDDEDEDGCASIKADVNCVGRKDKNGEWTKEDNNNDIENDDDDDDDDNEDDEENIREKYSNCGNKSEKSSLGCFLKYSLFVCKKYDKISEIWRKIWNWYCTLRLVICSKDVL